MEPIALVGGAPVRSALLPYARQTIEDDDVAAVAAALRGDWITQGPAVARFEAALAPARTPAEAITAITAFLLSDDDPRELALSYEFYALAIRRPEVAGLVEAWFARSQEALWPGSGSSDEQRSQLEHQRQQQRRREKKGPLRHACTLALLHIHSPSFLLLSFFLSLLPPDRQFPVDPRGPESDSDDEAQQALSIGTRQEGAA